MKGEEGGGSSTETYSIHTPLPPSPPACAPPLSGVRTPSSRARPSSHHRRCSRLALAGAYFRLRFVVAEPPATPGESARVAAADAVGLVTSSGADGEKLKTLTSDDPREAAAAKAVFAAAPPLTSTLTPGEGCVTSTPAADAAVAAASSATRRRIYERKEDMRPAVGGTAVIGTGPVPTSMPTSAVEVAVAVAPAAVSTVASREEEAVRIVAAEGHRGVVGCS